MASDIWPSIRAVWERTDLNRFQRDRLLRVKYAQRTLAEEVRRRHEYERWYWKHVRRDALKHIDECRFWQRRMG